MNKKEKTMSSFFFVMTLFFSLFFNTAFSQVTNVTGRVSDAKTGESIPGANVYVEGTNTKTLADLKGNFKLDVAKGATITVTSLGYHMKKTIFDGSGSLNIKLDADVFNLDQVVVIGYGEQKKKEITGAVGQVKSEELMKTASSDLGTALQGQIAGVNVTSSSGAPGSESNIMIRGLTSINGANRPLYVVDGIPFEGDPKLSLNEIESVDVLKDAASAAIYGTRGAAGVILITTKMAEMGKMKINADSYYGIQNITSGTPLMTVEEQLYATFLQANALSNTVYGNTWTLIEQNPSLLTNNTNLSEMFQNDYAPIQNHNLNVSGGKDGLAYNITGNFFSQEGMIIKSAYERFNVRSNTMYNKGKWNINTGLSFRIEDQQFAPWGLLQDAIRYTAYQPALSLDDSSIENAGLGTAAANLSYLGFKLRQRDNEKSGYFDGFLSAQYSFTKNLRFTTRLSTSYLNGTRIVINPSFTAYDDNGDVVPSQRSMVRNQSSEARKGTWENILNYNKKIGNHNFNFTGVYSAEKYSSSMFFAERSDIANNSITVLNGTTADPNVGSGNNPWTQDKVNTLIGMLGRLQYNYKGKYLVSASVRRDGSSRFQQQHWGTFPSVSLGWNVSDEKFWNSIRNVASSFKLRASKGTTGNQGIADYSYSANIILDNDYVFGAEGTSNLNLVRGAIQQDYANPNVRWETSISTNFGFDLGFFKNKLTFTGDFYKTNKEDMLFPVLLPPTAGGGSNAQVILNVGDMTNNGVEFAANYQHNGKLSWKTGLTFSHNRNKVTRMSGSNKIMYFLDSQISGHDNDADFVSALAEGYEGGAFFLIKTNGVINTPEELTQYQQLVPGAKIGDLRYVDRDKNNIIDINDREYVGSGTPDFELGLNLSANYKSFDFSTQWYGSFGAEIINGNKALSYKSGNHRDLIYQWSPQNTDSDIPVNRGATHDNYRSQTDFWLENGTFVRLRNVALGYTFPKKLTKKINIDNVRIHIAAQNPITITKYKGYDPEVGNNGLSTRGIDKGTYPVSSQFRTGIQFNF